MARLLTLTFLFEKKEYSAQVTVNEATDTNTISIYLPDRSLHHIIPKGKVILEVKEQQIQPSHKASPAENLKHNILNAYNEHESMNPPVNMW